LTTSFGVNSGGGIVSIPHLLSRLPASRVDNPLGPLHSLAHVPANSHISSTYQQFFLE
jgi:hypothetical protein